MTSSGRRRAGALALAGALTLVLGGCGRGGDAAVPAPEPAATEPSEATGHGDADADLPVALPSPVDDDAGRQAAEQAATAAVTAFARPDLDAATWWAELEPLLSAGAAVAYEGTDPAEVPATAVTGPARSAPSDSSFLATVLVPTDGGDHAVLLAREGAGAPWLVERITPVVPSGPGAVPPLPADGVTGGDADPGEPLEAGS